MTGLPMMMGLSMMVSKSSARKVLAVPAIGISARLHALPCRRQLEAHFVRAGRALDQREERGRAVQHREAGLDPVVAHGHLAPVDAVA